MGRVFKRRLACAIVVAVALAGVTVGTAHAEPATTPSPALQALTQMHPSASAATSITAAKPRRGPRPSKVRRVRVGGGHTSGSKARLVVAWAAASRATTYRVSISNSRAFPRGHRGRTVRTRDTSITLGRLKAGRAYCVWVRAERGRIRGPVSTRVCARTPAPVRKAGAPWVVAQRVNAGNARFTLKWRRTGGASSYDVIYAAGASSLNTRAAKVRRHVRQARGSVQSAVITGLTPGGVYCFQIRGRSRTGFGARGPLHCKVAQPSARALQPSKFVTTVATFNICGAVARCQRVPWSRRGPAVVRAIGDTDADIVAVQETRLRLRYLVGELRKLGYVEACSSAGAQAVFVRRQVYTVDGRTDGGVRFTNDRSHGACWVKLRHRRSAGRVVVSSIHLRQGPGPANSQMRARETRQVLGRLESAFGKVRDSKTPPFVLAGDFNSNRSYANDTPRKVLKPAGFDDAYDVAATYAAPYRASAHGLVARPRIATRWGSHIDRIFLPPGASATGWHTSMRLKGGRFVQPLPSDHSPVVASVHLPVVTAGLLDGLFGRR
ncbi:MAG: endonuclease/exonuclease/phosphatase family protein [Nocardioidaceae bacterium]|nr:endonuclease/exonuclease/phosphatase family protein [Nocardioidaceae bacterium]